ncbi:hypothetical protein QBC38DRAFT_396686 [Podospora fimiseda]|uniref:Cytochrome P450 n=1 Tax=Podospora fimiseda TaxID=252190 RepID=A0AAN7BJW0_9PEZI|nr:hypothetical protein QBC38DRAFT_396686 [Podospora fimiseda]
MTLHIPAPWHWLLIATLFIVYPIFHAIYNLYFHPLSKIPGPPLWCAIRLRYVFSQLSGNIVQDSAKFHQKYGHIVRVAPDEVSIVDKDIWADALQAPQISKDPRWWEPLPGLPALGIFGAINPDNHARVRKLISPAFTPRTLISQEPILQKYTSLLITRLREVVSANPDKPQNIVEWFNFTTFDIFGDLLFDESFECLHHSQYHSWMALLFNYAKSTVYNAVPGYYPWLGFVFKKLLPPSMKKMIRQHHQFILDKLDRRFKAIDRPDAMSHIIKAMQAEKTTISMDQLTTTAMDIVTAGSETTATALSAMVNYLVHHPDKLQNLTTELRTKFKDESEMTLDALREEKAPYLNAVINETLRMAPPIPWLPPRITPKEGKVICGTFLPGNTTLVSQIYLMNRSPSYFHSPDTFTPERYLPSSTSDPTSPFYNDQHQVVQPFSVGPKSCFGQYLAWAEMRLILARLLWAFDLEMTQEKEETVWEELKVFVFWEKCGVWVRMKVRDT